MELRARSGLYTGASFTLLALSCSTIIRGRNGAWHTTHFAKGLTLDHASGVAHNSVVMQGEKRQSSCINCLQLHIEMVTALAVPPFGNDHGYEKF